MTSKRWGRWFLISLVMLIPPMTPIGILSLCACLIGISLYIIVGVIAMIWNGAPNR